MKYYNTEIVFEEIPNEITLAFNISNCKIHCPDCHSKFLWEDVGTELNIVTLDKELNKVRDGISCIAFMGGEPDSVLLLANYIKTCYKNIKVALYRGESYIDLNLNYNNIDYLKIGPYIKELGGLDSKTTNQRFFVLKTENNYTSFIDNTKLFLNK